MKDKKVIFMGTPLFAVPILKELINKTNVIAVVTQPDKCVGRKEKLCFSPIKEVAIANNIKVLQPNNVKLEYDNITSLNPDIIVTCAYGQILPKELIYFPKYDTVNVHASLLPKLRGGAPIQRAIMNGDKKTGITIMMTDEGMDSGDILTSSEVLIEDKTYDELWPILSEIGAKLLMETLPKVFDGSIKRIKQNEEDVTKGFIIKKEDEKIDFNWDAKKIINHIKGLSSVPGAYGVFDFERIKLYNGFSTDVKSTNPGRISKITKDGFEVETGTYNIIINDICLPGKKRVLVKDLINGINKDKYLNKQFK